MNKYTKWAACDIENKIQFYIADAAKLAESGTTHGCSFALDGIKTRQELADAIRELGAAYIEKLKKIAAAGPVVRGDTISIFEKPQSTSKMPSIEDQEFMSMCLRSLRENGYVKAADADVYENITKEYPNIHPRKVRGAEARRYLYIKSGEALKSALKKNIKR